LDETLKPVDERKDPYTHYGLMPPEILRLDGRKDIMLEPDTMKDHLEIIGKKLAEMLKNKEENLGKQIARKHLAVYNHRIFYEIIKEGMKHGFRV